MKKAFILFYALLFLLPGASLFAEDKLVKGEVSSIPPHAVYTPTFQSDGDTTLPRNVILMIGDGTGLSQYASGYYAGGSALTCFLLKHMGLVTTQSASDYITDSAASGTAYATGQKTYNHGLGVDTDRKPLPNLPEILAKSKVVCGVISTDDLHGATPAAFFAHQPNRRMTDEVWTDLVSSQLIYFAAGSKEVFEQRPPKLQTSIGKAYTVVHSFDDPRCAKAKKLGVLPPAVETGFIVKGRGDFLPRGTRHAIDFLRSHTKKDKGFFLMVEGARVDKACHANQFESAVRELLDFDDAIAAALRFADEDGHTLVIICADHETGGLALGEADTASGTYSGVFVTGGHTALPVPLFAYGPHAQDFMGVQGNDEVGRKIRELLR